VKRTRGVGSTIGNFDNRDIFGESVTISSRSIKISWSKRFARARTVGRPMIRIRPDCKLSAKPPLIGLKSDHRDSACIRSLHLSPRARVVARRKIGRRGGGGEGSGKRKCTLGGSDGAAEGQGMLLAWLPKMNYANVDQLPGNVSLRCNP